MGCGRDGMCVGADSCRSKPCPGPLCCQQRKTTFLEVSARHFCLHGCLPWWLYVSGSLGVNFCITWAVPPSQSSRWTWMLLNFSGLGALHTSEGRGMVLSCDKWKLYCSHTTADVAGTWCKRECVIPDKRTHLLKVQAQYDSIKLSSGPGCSKWFQVLARWWVRWGQMWGACPDQGHLPCCWQHMLCPLHLEIKQLPWTALKPLILHKQRTLNYAGKFVYFCKGAFTLRLQTFSNRYISIGSPRQESLKTIPCRNTPFQCSFIKH